MEEESSKKISKHEGDECSQVLVFAFPFLITREDRREENTLEEEHKNSLWMLKVVVYENKGYCRILGYIIIKFAHITDIFMFICFDLYIVSYDLQRHFKVGRRQQE